MLLRDATDFCNSYSPKGVFLREQKLSRLWRQYRHFRTQTAYNSGLFDTSKLMILQQHSKQSASILTCKVQLWLAKRCRQQGFAVPSGLLSGTNRDSVHGFAQKWKYFHLEF